MREIPLNEIPRHTPWISRLLSLESFTSVARSIEKVDAEYDKDKYLKCLQFYDRSGGNISIDSVKEYELGMPMDEQVCISQNDTLYVTSWQEAWRRYNNLRADVMHSEIESSQVVVELGCGYGYNLDLLRRRHPKKTFVGGEYSQNAVRLAKALFTSYSNVCVEQFDFYDSDYQILHGLEGRVIVFTCHAVEQLPSAGDFLAKLRRCKNVECVFHFEPIYELYDEATLLGLLRRRYTQVNHYNQDLLTCLERGKVKIRKQVVDAIGLNPLNPTSIVSWRFR